MISIRPKKHLALLRVPRKIGTTGGSLKVTDYEDNPAHGRVVLLLRKSIHGEWVIVDKTVTDANGDYEFSVASGPSEQLIVVGIGNLANGERSVAMSGIIGVF
jgi:hypothetical protein